MDEIRKKTDAAMYVKRSVRTLTRWEEIGVLKKENGIYSREQLDKCKYMHTRCSLSGIEIDQFCKEVDVAMGALANIKTRFRQLIP